MLVCSGLFNGPVSLTTINGSNHETVQGVTGFEHTPPSFHCAPSALAPVMAGLDSFSLLVPQREDSIITPPTFCPFLEKLSTPQELGPLPQESLKLWNIKYFL